MEQLYSEALGKFLADRFVVGTCPKCGYTVSCYCVQLHALLMQEVRGTLCWAFPQNSDRLNYSP